MQVIMSLKKNRQMFFQTTEMQKATKQSQEMKFCFSEDKLNCKKRQKKFEPQNDLLNYQNYCHRLNDLHICFLRVMNVLYFQLYGIFIVLYVFYDEKNNISC